MVAAVDRLLNNVDVANGDVKLQKDNIAGLVTGVQGGAFNGLTMSYNHNGEDTLTDTEVCRDLTVSDKSLVKISTVLRLAHNNSNSIRLVRWVERKVYRSRRMFQN